MAGPFDSSNGLERGRLYGWGRQKASIARFAARACDAYKTAMENRRPRTVRAHDDGIDRWEMIDAAPATMLRGHVDRYTSYWEHTSSFAARRELAATSGVLIYALGAPLSITGADGIEVVLREGEAFAGGICDATSVSRALGPQAGVHVFMPLVSLATVCGAPVAAIANRVVNFADLAGDAARDLGGRLREADDACDRFDLLDDFLVRRLADAPPSDAPVSWAMARLAEEAPPNIAALAGEIGWSRKHLTARFTDVTGFTPQVFRRLARFERFTQAIARAPDDSLAGLAIEAGYYDQPHLTREVQAFSAMSPGELRQRILPQRAGVRDD